MRNAINYFYNLYPDDIRQNGKLFYFDIPLTKKATVGLGNPIEKMENDNVYGNHFGSFMGEKDKRLSEHYVLVVYNGGIPGTEYNGNNIDGSLLQEIYNIHFSLLKKNIYVHQIVLNKDNQIVTLIGGVPYVLMRSQHYKEKISFNSVWAFSAIGLDGVSNSKLARVDCGTLWANKNDHLEYQMNQLGKKHPLLRESLGYYIGLSETSIQLINSISLSNEKITKVVSHNRILPTDTLFDLYNPFNLVIDNRTRDMAEYFKNSYFHGCDISRELNIYFRYGGLSETEYILFLSRMIYPTYYFDLYEDIINGNNKDAEIKKVIARADDYERLLKKIYLYFKSFLRMPPIEWFER